MHHTTRAKALGLPQANPSSVYYLHPQIQRQDPRVLRSETETSLTSQDGDIEKLESPHLVSQFAFMTPVRQEEQESRMRNIATALGLPLLDGQAITKARWESSWDGIHYSMVSISDQMKVNGV